MSDLNQQLHVAFSAFLVEKSFVTSEIMVEISRIRNKGRPMLGELALRERFLKMTDVFRILGHQAEHGGLFGEIAIQLGLMAERDIQFLLKLQEQRASPLAEILVETKVMSEQQVNAAVDEFIDEMVRRRLLGDLTPGRRAA